MNNQRSPSFLKISKDRQENDDDYTNVKLSKKGIEKFKPKQNKANKKNLLLRGAENKVKSILSSFLLTMESDDDKNSKKIKFLVEKLSSKKAKFNHDVNKKSKKNIQKLKPSNSLFLNGIEYSKDINNDKSDIPLIKEKRRIYKEDNIINIINKKTPKKLNLLKQHSKYNSDIYESSSYISKSNNKSDFYARSNINIEEENKQSSLRKTSFKKSNQDEHILKSIKSKAINPKKKDENKTCKYSYCSPKNGKNEEQISSLILQKSMDKYKDLFLFKNHKKLKSQISFQNDKKGILNKIKGKFLPQNIDNNEKKGKSYTNKNLNNFKDIRVGTVLKDLQVTIKNSIILRPEKIELNEKNYS